MQPDKMLTVTEVARRLGVSYHMVKKLIKLDAIQSFQPGDNLPRRVWESELTRYRAKFTNSPQNCELSEHSQTR